MATEADLISKYIALRDRKKAMEAAHEEVMRPYSQALEQIEGYFLGVLNERQTDSTKCSTGIAYKTSIMTPKLVDREALLAYVDQTNDYDVFTNSVSKDFVKFFVEEHKTNPPGIEVSYFTKVNIRKA